MENFEYSTNRESLAHELRNKYSQEIIEHVWKRLLSEGMENADVLIGTRSTIDNVDADKFWNAVKKEDIESLLASYERQKEDQLIKFNTYKHKADNMKFIPELGEFISDDTSFYDTKISEARMLLSELEKGNPI